MKIESWIISVTAALPNDIELGLIVLGDVASQVMLTAHASV